MGVIVFVILAIFFVIMFFFSLVNIGEYGVGSLFWLIVSGIAIYHLFKGLTKGSDSSSSARTSSNSNSTANLSSNGRSTESADPLKYAIYADLANRHISSSRSDDEEVDNEDDRDWDKDDWDEDDDYLFSYDDKEDDW